MAINAHNRIARVAALGTSLAVKLGLARRGQYSKQWERMNPMISEERAKPTISELEALLREGHEEIEVLPNGKARVIGHGASTKWMREGLEAAIRAADWGKVETMLNADIRHQRGAQPLDYLRHWLNLFRPLGCATHDDSWGELEKEITIAVRTYYEMRDQLSEIAGLVACFEEWLQATAIGDNPEGSDPAKGSAYLQCTLAQIKFRAGNRREFPRK